MDSKKALSARLGKKEQSIKTEPVVGSPGVFLASVFERSIRRSKIASTLFFSLLAYTSAWLITVFFGRLLWNGNLPTGDQNALSITFFIPFILVGGTAFWSVGHQKLSRFMQVFFLIALIFVFFNVVFLHIPIKSYGDTLFLSKRVELGEVFSRWMIGSSLLKSLYQCIILPLAKHNVLPIFKEADIFIRLSGSILMIIFSILLLNRYPNHLAVLLPLSVPIWLLLSSGYSEYYPFIAPIFLSILVFLWESDMRNIPPWLMGLLISSIALLYAGFVPVSGLILCVYGLRVGLKTGFQAFIASGLFAILLIVVLWPGSLPGFYHQYIDALNLGDHRSIPYYQGKSILNTPFFKIQFAFAAENIYHLFFMNFWGGGIAPLLLVLTGVKFFKHRDHSWFRQNWIRFLPIGLLFGWQIFYFFFMLPKLGPVKDIDLYYSVYLTIAFVAGLLVDELLKETPPEKRVFIQNIVFSLVAGNTAAVLLHLLIWGLPMIKLV